MTDFRKTLSEVEYLHVDTVYKGGRNGNSSDDPLNHLIGVSNQGGFRYIGTKELPRLVVLTSSLKDPDWPDGIDKENGIYTYHGDNKKPGKELHDTPRFGNLLLRDMFERAHGTRERRLEVPPVLVFTGAGEYRDVKFLGLAVPGAGNIKREDDLVAIWKLGGEDRFQNYQAKFTILKTQHISLSWIEDVKAGNPLSENCPLVWRKWVDAGKFEPLKAPKTLKYRKKEEQLPNKEPEKRLINIIREYFRNKPFDFEKCAAAIVSIAMKDIVAIDVTRSTRDGGRDAIGKFRIGPGDSSVHVDFALEAKCYDAANPVTVKDLSRLISRLRHRQFGILVTTSYVAIQAYQEIVEDEHPIIIISAIDIVKILKGGGYGHEAHLRKWLQALELS